MAEKKKRFRPTLTAYRALENEVSTLKEENAKLLSKNHVLEQSNELMEAELKRLRNALDEIIKSYALLGAEMAMLKARGFWARVFNL